MTHTLLTHESTGTGDAVVLLNGGGMTMAAWDPFVGPLAVSFRVVRCDFRGQLLSPGTPHTALTQHADDLAAVLDTLQIPAAHLVGTSFGGMVGLVFAASYPDRARSLIAGTTTGLFTSEQWEAARALVEACEQAAAGTGEKARVMEILATTTWSDEYRAANGPLLANRRALAEVLSNQYYAGLLGILQLLNGLDLRPLLPAITCPTLVIGAECDRTFPVEHSRSLAQRIRGARLEILPGAAHGVFLEDSARVLGLIQSFLAT